MSLQPVVIYEEDDRELSERLDAFLRASRASLVILIDRSGQVISQRGYTKQRPAEELAAMAAAALNPLCGPCREGESWWRALPVF